MAYFNKTPGKDMHTKTPQELLSTDSRYVLPAIVPVIFKTEDNLTLGNINNTMIGYGHPVSILAKISKNMLCRSKGRLTENYPWLAPCSFNMLAVSRQKLISGEILLNPIHEPAPELKTQLSNRVKIFTCFTDMFHFAFDGIAKGRNNAVYVRMQAQVLSPGMKYADGSALNRVMAVAKGAQNIPDRFEQVIIEPLAVSEANFIQYLRYSENNMIMPDRVRLPDAVFNPECLFCGLAFRTMTVTAGVIAYMLTATIIALILMSAQRRRPAHGQGLKNAELILVWLMTADKIFAKPADYICNFVFGAAHKASLYRVSKGL
jgi:hypothetical protein